MFRLLVAVLRFCVLAAGLAAGVGATVAGAQTRILLPPQPVAVEFRAFGDRGIPILDLTATDVVLKVDGRVRTVRSLALVRFDTDSSSRTTDTGLAEPFATNTLPIERRDILLVLEDDSIAPGTEQPVRAAVDRLLAGLSPRDRVGLLNIPRGGTNIGLTTDRELIRAGVAKLVGLSTRGQTTNDARCRTIFTLQALKDLFLAVRGGPSTTIVFFSSGVAPPDTTTSVVLGQSSDLCIVKIDYFNELKNAAALSRVNFYAIYVFNDTAIPQATTTNELVAGLESLAGAANGDTIRLTTQDATSIVRLARETSAFYRATFDPEPEERDDRLHRVDLSVNRSGVAIRVESTLAIARAQTRAGSATPPSVTDLLRTTDMRRDLPLRAAAYASKGDTKNTVKVVVVFEPTDSTEPPSAAALGLYDARGRLTAQVTLREEELAQSPPFTAISATPGTYRLRVAAKDRAGRLGTVDTRIDAELTKADPVTLSAMVLGTTSRGRFAPKLLFRDDPSLIAYFEIYGVPKATEVSAAFELATTPDGPAIGAVPARIQLGGEEGTWQVTGGIALSEVPPGDYVLRALVVVDEKLVGKVARTLRKVE
ncbi:MAG: hypothetical protein AB1806_07740 [Acidobacteriota bacterium]